MWTDYGFSIIRNFLIGGDALLPSGLLVGTGSAPLNFSDIYLGSPLDPTRRGFQSVSGIGYSVEWEGLIDSGDITTGSVVREIGMIAQSGGKLFFRSLINDIELFGSIVITPIIDLNIK